MQPDPSYRPWAAYVVPFPYPWGQAGSRRVDGISRSIAATGRDVVVIATPGPDSRDGAGPHLVVTDTVTGGSVRTIAREALPANPLRRQWAHHVSGARDALDLIDQVSATLPSHIVTYGTLATPLVQVLRWGRSHGVPVLADVVERYSPVQFGTGPLSPGYGLSTAGFQLLAPRVDGVIAISRHLQSHFAARGVPTVRVPPTADLSQIPVGEPAGDTMRFGYFGSPGRKDLLDVVVESFVRVRRASGRDDLRLIIGGPGTRKVLASRAADEFEGVQFLGRVPQQEVSKVLGSLHATVLARPPARYAQAGYPTKVVESLSAGTPVVCNLTSDLNEVIYDGETGWVASGPTVDEMAVALSRAVAAGPEGLREMRQRARAVAEEHFDSGRYVESLGAFLEVTD